MSDCLKMTEEQIAIAKKQVALAKNALKQYPDASLAAGFLRDVPLMREATLWNLAYALNHETHGCTRSDVEGLIEHVEMLIAGDWPMEVE